MNGCVEDFEEVRVPVPWGYITGKWWGRKDTQPIIAIHGWQDNCGTFDNLAPILRDRGLSLYCIDLPGHGLSSHLPKGQKYYLFWDGVFYVRRIVKHFGWEKIVIMGHSLGGGIGFLYSAAFPDEVSKYISIDIASPYVRTVSKMIDVMGSCVDTFFRYEQKYSSSDPPIYDYEEMVGFMLEAHKGSITKESAEILLKRGMRPVKDKNGYTFTRDPRLKVSMLGFVSKEQVLEMASRITCEVLNIRATGGLERTVEDLSYDEVMNKIRKNAKHLEVEVIEGTHHLHLNDAKSVAPCIHYFLTS